ncbi:MAG: LppM family (lipo)protein [Actinomycetota bacterium]
MTMQRSRRAGLAARLSIAAFAAVAMTGCIKMDMDLTLEGETASGTVILGVEKSFLEMAGSDSDDVLGDLGSEADLPEDASVEPYEDDTYVGQQFSFDDAALSDFQDEQMSITYDPDAGEYEVSGSMDMSEMTGDTGDMPAGMADSMMESFDIVISITFPGEVIEHNGELSGNTVTWRPAAGETNELRALASESGSGGLPVWLIAGLAGLVVVVGGGLVAFFVLRNRPDAGSAEGELDDAARA